MRKTLLLVAAVNGVLSNPVPEELVGVKADPPSGIGTGVTVAIAPPGGIPRGCYNVWNGPAFGIAAVPIAGSKLVDMPAEPAEPAFPSFSLPENGTPPQAAHDIPDMDIPLPTVAVKLLEGSKAQVAGAAPGDAEPDVTVTRKTTRTHTRTVTVNSGMSSAAEATPTAMDLTGLKTIKAAQLYQVGDGQVQAPPNLSEIPLKPKPTPEGGASPTAFAPLPSSAPRISQIGDGQIQAPTVAAGSPKAAKSPSSAPEAGADAPLSPKPAAAPKPDAAPKPAAAPAPAAKPEQVAAPAPAAAPPMVGMDMGGHSGHMKRQSDGAVMGGYGCKNKDGSTLAMTLKNGILKDKRDWTGYIADNRQFQFDSPPQAGAQITAGWSVCDDGFLALGPSKVFYQCLSGSFYNLYDKNIAAQCNPVNLILLEQRDC